ncbi:MAG: radical SAM protein [Desulforudis sp.]|jgi:radical SAM superfamily enzyme YgiQ (UPF0313 family)|nr:MAG: radical SAM protein [Desulforudis sp.]
MFISKVKICLVNIESTQYPLRTTPLGIISLGGYLKHIYKNKVVINYIDTQIEHNKEKIIDLIKQQKPDLIGISLKPGSEPLSYDILDIIFRTNLDSVVILGGITPTYGHSSLLNNYNNTFCCIGRGEHTLQSLTDMVFRNNIMIDKIPNIAYVKNGYIHLTKNHFFNLNECPKADWDGFFSYYSPNNYEEIWIERSSGCRRKGKQIGCSFCSILPNGGCYRWSKKKLSVVFSEINSLLSFGIRHIRFTDEEFFHDNSDDLILFAHSMLSLSQQLKKCNDRFSFDLALRTDDVVLRSDYYKFNYNHTKLKALKILKLAGLDQVYIGIESGNNCQLKRYNKGITVKQNMNAILAIRQIGIQVAAGWIMFDPLMKKVKEIEENLNFLKLAQLIPTNVYDDFVPNPISCLKVIKGSQYQLQLEKYNVKTVNKDDSIEIKYEYINKDIGFIVEKLTSAQKSIWPVYYLLKNIVALGRFYSNNFQQLPVANEIYFRLKHNDILMLDAILYATSDSNNIIESIQSDDSIKHIDKLRQIIINEAQRIIRQYVLINGGISIVNCLSH